MSRVVGPNLADRFAIVPAARTWRKATEERLRELSDLLGHNLEEYNRVWAPSPDLFALVSLDGTGRRRALGHQEPFAL